jgi:hypothetical protein
MVELLAPWEFVEEKAAHALETELVRELAHDHALAAKAVRVLARRADNDDVLFEVAGVGYAVVHLTWARHREAAPGWPTTHLFSSFEDWTERRMKPDHDEYTAEG